MIIHRRNRLANVTSGLPDTLWWVVIIGAPLDPILPWFLVYDRQLIQYLTIVMMAAKIGILIYLMGAMDNHFRGDFSVTTETFELVHKLMKS